jgi:hypothetical protein
VAVKIRYVCCDWVEYFGFGYVTKLFLKKTSSLELGRIPGLQNEALASKELVDLTHIQRRQVQSLNFATVGVENDQVGIVAADKFYIHIVVLLCFIIYKFANLMQSVQLAPAACADLPD